MLDRVWKLLELLDRVITPQNAGGRHHFLLIKAWGCGFWSDMNHIFGCLLLAEVTGRIPVTHWGRNSLYGDGTDADAFRFYFQPVSPFGIRYIETARRSTFFPPKWSAATLRRENLAKWNGAHSRMQGVSCLGRPETVVVSDFYIHLPDLLPLIPTTHKLSGRSLAETYRWLADKYLHLRSEITAEIEAFYHARMAGLEPIIAAHYRGTDKIHETDYMPSLESYFDIIDRAARDWCIFLLTDEVRCVEAFCHRYGSRVIFTDAVRSTGKIPVHFSRASDRVRLGIDVIKDIYLALRCQKFIGLGMSNPSAIVSILKDWAEGDCTLLGPSLLDINFTQTIGCENSSR